MPVAIHPAMGRIYRKQVGALREALNEEGRRVEAIGLIRGLIDRIILTPEERDGRRQLAVERIGALTSIRGTGTR